MMRAIPTLAALLILIAGNTWAGEGAPLRLLQTIALPGVEGRIDHLAIDLGRQRLYVAELGNNTLGVIDLHVGRRVREIAGLSEPQGVLFAPDVDRIVVTNGGTGAVDLFDGGSLERTGTVALAGDADNVRYDADHRAVYVGYGDGALGIIDATGGRAVGDIPLAGHPEAFQLERSGPRIFVNVPAAGQVAVVDRAERAAVAAWEVTGAGGNFPMALDEARHRLFVGARRPPALLVFDTGTGAEVARANACADTDDVFYDAARGRLYLSCGEGFIDVLSTREGDGYARIARIATAPGARTSLFVPEQDRLYLAVPRRGSQGAEVRVYQVPPAA